MHYIRSLSRRGGVRETQTLGIYLKDKHCNTLYHTDIYIYKTKQCNTLDHLALEVGLQSLENGMYI